MKVLVTGATGFIGRQAVSQLADAGAEVIVACRHPVGGDRRFKTELVDLLARGAPEALIERVRPTHLLHLAWNATPKLFWSAIDNMDWSAATIILMRAFADAGGKRAVFAGTCAEYTWDRAVLAESGPLAPATFYGHIKDSTRRAVVAAGEQFGIPTAWARLFWLHGPHEPPGRLVSDVAAALLAGAVVDCSAGLQKRDYIHVADAAGALVCAVNSNFQGCFNIGSGQSVSVRDLVGDLARILGREELVRFGALPSPPNDPPELRAAVQVLHTDLAFRPRFTAQEAIRDTANWWLALPRRQVFLAS